MKATVNITIVSRTFRRRGAPAVKEADVITVAPVRESLPPAPRKGLLSRIIRLLSPLLLLPLLPAQDTPYTFQLESVDLTRGLGDGTLTAEAVQTGNSFVVSVSLSANGNTSSGTVRWDLTRASFNGRTATIGTAPFLIASGLGPQFTGNLTHNGGNRSLALGVTVNTVIATATVGECDKQAFLGTASMVCAITSFPLQTRTGRRFARVAFEILIAVAGSARTVAVGASYAFEPAPNSIQFIPTGSSVTPDPSKGLATGTVTFGGRVRYTRQAASFLALRLFDLPTGGILQGSSDFIAAAQTSGEQNLEIKDFAVKDDVEQLYLKAVIIDRTTNSVTAETAAIKYTRLADLSISEKELELVQVIQDDLRTVPIYRRKPTVLRVFVKQKGENDNPFRNITAQVTAKSNLGRDVPGTPVLLNQTNGIMARETHNRAREDHSLNYLLPAEWTEIPVTLQVELIIPPGRDEGPTDNNKLELAVLSPAASVQRISVDTVKICVDGRCPPALKPETLIRLQNMFPTDLVAFGKFNTPLKWPPTPSVINRLRIKETDLYTRLGQIELFRYIGYVGRVTNRVGDVYLAILPEMPSKPGAADVPEGRASMVGAFVPDDDNEVEERGVVFVQASANAETAVHEVGHLFGLRHIVRDDSCGAKDEKSSWKYPSARIADPGFDPLSGKLVSLLAPDIMTYCKSRWISVEHYNQLAFAMKNWRNAEVNEIETAGQQRPRSAAGATVVASGTISRDGASGTLLPLFPSESFQVRATSRGTHCLRWLKGSSVTGERCFSPRFEDADGVLLDEAGYSFSLVVPGEADALVLFSGDTELARLTAGPVPSVQIQSPAADDLLQGKSMVRWSGRAESYLVQFSPDNGATWDVIAPGTPDSEAEIDASDITASTILIRVTASNGLDFVSVTAGPFRIAQNARLQAPPASLDFGTLGVGDTVAKTVALMNTGASALSIESLSLESGDFSLISSLGAGIGAGGNEEIGVSFRPLTAGQKRAQLVIRTNDRVTPTVTIDLTGNGTNVKAPRIETSASSLDFGDVATGQTRDLNLSVQNTGTSPLTLSALTISNARFTLARTLTFPLEIEARSSIVIALRFSPTAAGAQTGTITIANNDTDRRVDLRGNGVTTTTGGGGGTTAGILQVDDGSMENAVGAAQGGQSGYFLNRLTPAGYPATLRAVQIVFPAGELPIGAAVSVLSAAHASGTGGNTIGGLTFQRTAATVTATNAFVEFTVPPLTVNSGDFVVGFTVLNPPNVFPGALDTSPPSRQRSYFGTDGLTFGLLDAGGSSGNLMIRARVDYTGGGTTPPPAGSLTFDPSSLTFTAAEAGQVKFVRATNNGSSTVTITAVSSSNPSFVDASNLPAATGPGSFNNLGIRFSPTAAGTHTGTITVTTTSGVGGTFNVTGTSTGTGGGTGGGTSTKVTATSAAGWPNGRFSNNLPPNAIDGSTSTFTWTTESFNTASPSYLGVGLAAAASVNRIRLYKDNDAGGPGLIAKNLSIEYTTSSTSTPVASRTWQPVSGLANGFQGTELMTATAVNANGTVTADNHNSLASGWASLTFNAVDATGIRVGFSNSTPISVNHYRVYEFEVYGGGSGSGGTPPPTTGGGGGCTSGIGTSSTAGLPARPTCAVLDAANPLATGLAGLFLMNEGTGTTVNNLVNNRTAAFAGAATPAWNGGDPSVTFRGGAARNSFLDAGTDAAFDRMPTSRITIVAKVNVSALAVMGICEKNDNNSADGFLFGIERTGDLKFTVEKSANLRVLAGGGAIRTGQWVQVAVTWDGTVGTAAAARLYVNGVEQNKVQNSSGSGTLGFAGATNQPFRIGTASFDDMGSLNGRIGYLAVYKDRILTTTEMTQLDARLPIR